LVLRAAALSVMALALGGPTPGFIGNCDQSGPAIEQNVDPHDFCTHFHTYFCYRDRAAGRLTSDAAQNTCVANVPAQCNGFNIPVTCVISESLANACYNALLRSDNLATLDANVTQCQISAICGGAMLEGI
jgi:hypothetical protein